MKTILIATLGMSFKGPLNAILEIDPDEVWFIYTEQSQARIADIEQALRGQNHRVPDMSNGICTVHNDIQKILTNIQPVFAKLAQQHTALSLDITSGTVPMSIAAWEAAKNHPNIQVSWLDNVQEPTTYILQMA
jgi:hypothetical protein